MALHLTRLTRRNQTAELTVWKTADLEQKALTFQPYEDRYRGADQVGAVTQFVQCCGGQGVVLFQDQRKVQLKPGLSVVIPPGTSSHWVAGDEGWQLAVTVGRAASG